MKLARRTLFRTLAAASLSMTLAFNAQGQPATPGKTPTPVMPSPVLSPASPGANSDNTDNTSADAGQSKNAPLPLDELRKFTEVFQRIKETYVEKVSDTTLLNNAIKGMVDSLDPHSAYMGPKDFSALEETTTGEFGGLGLEVGLENGFVKVITPIDDTPAQKAGMQPGDLIIKINDHPVKGMTLEEAVNMMRGKAGSEITLTIVREGKSGPFDVKLKRAIIKVTSVKTHLLEPGYGYLRITEFQAGTGEQFIKGFKSLEKVNKGPLKGLVLDLRNNPGGVLQAAVSVADSMLNKGLIVYTKGRIPSSQLSFSAKPGDITHGIPIVVLINGGSASASEILSGALQDNHRAVIMGTRSFGKGSVQTVMPLGEDSAIKLTTARYYTPSGRSIQAVGITPDIEVKQAKLTETDSQPFFTEADLTGHLTNDKVNAKKAREKITQEEDKDANKEKAIDRDFQLRSALNLLKGLTIFREKGPTTIPADDAGALKNKSSSQKGTKS